VSWIDRVLGKIKAAEKNLADACEVTLPRHTSAPGLLQTRHQLSRRLHPEQEANADMVQAAIREVLAGLKQAQYRMEEYLRGVVKQLEERLALEARQPIAIVLSTQEPGLIVRPFQSAAEDKWIWRVDITDQADLESRWRAFGACAQFAYCFAGPPDEATPPRWVLADQVRPFVHNHQPITVPIRSDAKATASPDVLDWWKSRQERFL
jgi:hypothetical protein